MTMRLAFVSTILDFPWGGADTLWTHAAESSVARGDQLLLSTSPATAESPRIAALARRGARLHLRRPRRPVPSFSARLAGRLRRSAGDDGLVRTLARFQPDLVIFSLGGTYDMILHPACLEWLASSRTRYRLIANWQAENPVLPDADRTLACRSLTGADCVYFVSTRNLAVTRRHMLHALPNARVIHNPLRWVPGDVSPWPASPALQLATVSRLDETKGVHLLLHALAGCPRRENWRLTIFGAGPAEAHLRATVAHLGLASSVEFAGHVAALGAIWAQRHLLVSPSLDDGVPMTIPEAMLCQRPVLATAVGGAEDWLQDGETGFLCPAPTLPLLAAALERAFAAADRWKAMGTAAAAAARLRYRPDDYLSLLT